MSNVRDYGTLIRQKLMKIRSIIDILEYGIRQPLKAIAIIALIGLTVAVNVQVLFRYILGDSLAWTGQFSILLNIWLTYVGGAVAYYAGDHVSVEYFHGKTSPSVQRGITAIINLLISILGIAMVIWGTQLALSVSSSQSVNLGISLFWTQIPLAIGGIYLTVESTKRIVAALSVDVSEGNRSMLAVFLISLLIISFLILGDYLGYRLAFPVEGSGKLLIIFGLLITLILLDTPIAFAMALSVLLFLLVLPLNLDILKPVLVIQQMQQAMGGFTLLAIPLFVYAGQLMTAAGLTTRLIDFANMIVGRLRAGLSHVNVVASVFFAGISGSAVADTAAVGGILIPEMNNKGYDAGYSGAITCASAVIGPIIPPSIIMIIYAVTVPSVSVGGMFAAGVIPGLLMGIGLIGTTQLVGIRTDWKSFPDQSDSQTYSTKEALSITKDATLALIMPLIILGGILSGVFTATEAGGVAVLYAFITGAIVYREMSISEFIETSYRSVTLSGVTLFIIGAAKPLTQMLALKSVPSQISSFLLSITQSELALLILIVVILSVLAMFIEAIANVILWAPVFAPIMLEIGVNPLHFGIIMMLTFTIGMTTPPMGGTLFVAAPIGETSIEEIIKEIIPFYISNLSILAIVILFPKVALFIPNLLGYG